MPARRSTLLGVFLAISCLAFWASTALAQRGGNQAPDAAKAAEERSAVECPECEKIIEFSIKNLPGECPHCSKKITITAKADGDGWTVTTSTQNALKKYLLPIGIGLLVVSMIAMLLKYTVLAKPVKKKKKRRDDDEEDDRPRKKRRSEDDDEGPRRMKKKPRIVDEDDE